MDSKASIEFQAYNRSYPSRQRLSYGSLQYLSQSVSVFKTLAGVVVLIVAAYVLLYLKTLNDKSLTKEVLHQKGLLPERESAVASATVSPELQPFHQLKSFEQIFGLTKLECGKEETFESNL